MNPKSSLDLAAISLLVLTACGPQSPAPSSGPVTAPPVPSATLSQQSNVVGLTPAAVLPLVQAGAPRILFINGDHIPDSGYAHSRVRDDGSKPESFSQLRAQVLEGELKLDVDEFILSSGTSITPGLLAPYAAIVLGSNGRVLASDEVNTLAAYYASGGGILFYADFQYGPSNWASDNAFLAQFGIEVFPDNFQPTTTITDITPSHPIMSGVGAFATEGSSQFLIAASVLSDTQVLSRCSPLARPGCAVQAPEQAKIKPGDVVACTWVRENAAGGRLAGTCDRNTFHNGPGVGTALNEFDNRRYAANLFRWIALR